MLCSTSAGTMLNCKAQMLPKMCLQRVAALAQWIRLRLPSCGPGFESQAHPGFFQFVNKLWCVKDENKNEKRPGLVHLKKCLLRLRTL